MSFTRLGEKETGKWVKDVIDHKIPHSSAFNDGGVFIFYSITSSTTSSKCKEAWL